MKGKKNISVANVVIGVNNMLGRFSAEEIVKGFVEDYPKIKDDFKKVLYDNGFRWQKDSYQGNQFGNEGIWINYGYRLSIKARWGKVNANAIIYVEKEFLNKVKKFFDLYLPSEGMDSENDDYDLLNKGEIFKKDDKKEKDIDEKVKSKKEKKIKKEKVKDKEEKKIKKEKVKDNEEKEHDNGCKNEVTAKCQKCNKYTRHITRKGELSCQECGCVLK